MLQDMQSHRMLPYLNYVYKYYEEKKKIPKPLACQVLKMHLLHYADLIGFHNLPTGFHNLPMGFHNLPTLAYLSLLCLLSCLSDLSHLISYYTLHCIKGTHSWSKFVLMLCFKIMIDNFT